MRRRGVYRGQNLRPTYSYEVGRASYGAFETDAKFLVSDGRTYGMIDGSRVDHRGKTLFSAYPNRCNQLDFVTVLQRAGTWGSYEDVLAGAAGTLKMKQSVNGRKREIRRKEIYAAFFPRTELRAPEPAGV